MNCVHSRLLCPVHHPNTRKSYFPPYKKIVFTFKSEFLLWCFQNYAKPKSTLLERGDRVCYKNLHCSSHCLCETTKAIFFSFSVYDCIHSVHLSGRSEVVGTPAGSGCPVFWQSFLERFAAARELSFTESLDLSPSSLDKTGYLLSLCSLGFMIKLSWFN